MLSGLSLLFLARDPFLAAPGVPLMPHLIPSDDGANPAHDETQLPPWFLSAQQRPLYDRINTSSCSPIKCPPSDACGRARDVLEWIQDCPMETTPDMEELQAILCKPHVRSLDTGGILGLAEGPELVVHLPAVATPTKKVPRGSRSLGGGRNEYARGSL
ncbi:hypothetical protein HPB51_023023 [Rhipicephalus microplus]|uniref:Uncharacterized protein n=1 Tax=Rhipicephalus microplus TaxID=6941 RepID=A0A9J6D867_RHIMP|nr:hypothetical protein HPB51_023023 [Rhipicephalus microplus]